MSVWVRDREAYSARDFATQGTLLTRKFNKRIAANSATKGLNTSPWLPAGTHLLMSSDSPSSRYTSPEAEPNPSSATSSENGFFRLDGVVIPAPCMGKI